MSSDFAVFGILGVALALVGVHLILYSRRQSRLIRRFAASQGYPYRNRDDGSLSERLEKTFGISEDGCARTFERIRDVVSIPDGEIFRAVELLDLNPHGSAGNPHHARVCVRFSGLPDLRGWHGIFHVTPALDVVQRYPISTESVAGHVRAFLEEIEMRKPPCALSLTIADREALAYLEPTVVGSLTRSDLEYLAGLPAAARHRSDDP